MSLNAWGCKFPSGLIGTGYKYSDRVGAGVGLVKQKRKPDRKEGRQEGNS